MKAGNDIEFKTDDFLDACLPGNSESIRKIKDQIHHLNYQLGEVKSILLLGAPGVGKTYISEIIAKHRCYIGEEFMKGIDGDEENKYSPEETIHQRERYVETRGEGILEHCGNPYRELSIPLFEGELTLSQLFGHTKGAFTGASENKEGFLALKNVNDVLLDEIGYASIDMQQKLLQVLQSGTFCRLGSTEPEKVRTRLMFATNQDLKELVRKKKFQEDLFWRLIHHVIVIPPLTERREEMKLIVEDFLTELNDKFNLDRTLSSRIDLSPTDWEWIESYSWPGNIRELKMAVGRWFFYREKKISLKDAWTDVKDFILETESEYLIELNEVAIKKFLNARVEQARLGSTDMDTPDQVVKSIFQPAWRKVAGILVECIDESGSVSTVELDKLFSSMSGESLRTWKSKNKVRK